jgi:hypothetical protein
METFKHKQIADERVVIVNRDTYDKIKKLLDEDDAKQFKSRKSRHASFTQVFIGHVFEDGKSRIASASRVELLDTNGNVVKTFTSFTELVVEAAYESGDRRVYIRVRVVDNSTDAYSFKYMNVYYTVDSGVDKAIIHTFNQVYTKGSDQIADITVRTGVGGLVLT